MMRTLTTAALFTLAASEGPTLRGSRRLQTTSTVAQGLFVEMGGVGPIGAGSTRFECGKPGYGTHLEANGPGGCLNVQAGIAGFNTGDRFSGPEVARNQTVQSFLVYKCGMVAIHSHANAVETNTVVHGEGIIAQLTPNSGELQMSRVREGDSFFFAQGSYHWWVNLGEEDLLTIGTFVNTAGPDAALDGYDEGHGIVDSFMHDPTLLHLLIGKSDGTGYNTKPFHGESPLFPMLDADSCDSARAMMQDATFTTNSFQINPPGTKLFMKSELESGKYSISSDNCPVNGPGGGLRPLAGVVGKDIPFVTGTHETNFNGGLAPNSAPQPTLWPGLTNVGSGTSLVKFVVGYCGTVAIHTHVNAAEWNTVIEGEGEVAFWDVNGNGMVKMQVKKGDTFVFPQGAAHYWVNYSPTAQLVTVGGFTAPFPDTAMLESFLSQTKSAAPFITEAVLGKNYKIAAELDPSSGADTLFPLLPRRSPSSCGGDMPCYTCQ